MFSNSQAFALRAACIVSLFSLVSISCVDDTGPVGFEEPDKKLGESCQAESECREGLSCIDGTCDAKSDGKKGADCSISKECGKGLYCEPTAGKLKGKCTAAGDGDVGDPCGSMADCKKGLTCKAEGLGGVCAETEKGDVGASCEKKTDCLAGLNCSVDPQSSDGSKTCQAGAVSTPHFFEGVECTEEDTGPARVYFEVPDKPEKVTEFYRLPFPNDIRLKNGKPNLAGHPTPGKDPLGFDIVQTYVDQISSNQEGYGLQQAVFFRFSKPIKFGTLKASGDSSTLQFLNITPGSDRYDKNPSYSWQYSTGRNKYICPNWLGLRVPMGRPLAPNTTYAVILSKGIKDSDGNPLKPDGDFKKMLADSKPKGALGKAWDAYKPLRDWIKDQDDAKKDDLLAAAVFTTGAPRQPVRKLRTPAREKTPEVKDMTLCKEGAESPCDDGFKDDKHRRGCFGTSDTFDEIQGQISLPIFQKGKAPYLDKGGAVEFKNGKGVVQKRKDVCMTMTVPKKVDMPSEGWPLLIYAPGTGATARSLFNDLASKYSELGGMGNKTGVMMMSWEQVQHYRRRGDSELSPERLVFNYGNPDAAMGNFLQGAADVFAVVKWAEEFSLDKSKSPTGEKVTVNPDEIYFLGHSQGGTTGPLALPYEPKIKGAILSGSGAGLVHSLLGKTSPSSVPDGVKLVLHETKLSAWHPVLNLLQGHFDPVDPLNHAKYVAARQVEMETTPSHVFHLYGTGDTFTPPAAIETMARALRVSYIKPLNFKGGTPSETDPPVSENMETGGSKYTGVGRQYEPDGYDGHFVLFRHKEAQDDVREFLSTAIIDGVPKIQD